ncbi:hypothetical protein [Paraliobacillus sp. X-1268]|uniref:hypothetical protein n=1 Tax=Paraliobacillus sp. X-1268 TaxID=2213193 RepID=UPI000E3EC69E|nr:hypothetical protein [Paraliobacillus sp. X-1268]
MKVYVIELDNGQEYSDYENWVDSVFSSYRSASQSLIDKGFIPYSIKNNLGECVLIFENPKVSGIANQEGWITEYELQN